MSDKESINKILKKLGTDFDTQPAATQKKILKVANTIEKMSFSYEANKTAIKENKINISNVAKQSGISRKTFYNNEILGRYVELMADSTAECNSNDKETIKRLKENLSLNNEKLNGLLDNLVEVENLKYENDKLIENVKVLQGQYNELQIRYNDLLAQQNSQRKQPMWS